MHKGFLIGLVITTSAALTGLAVWSTRGPDDAPIAAPGAAPADSGPGSPAAKAGARPVADDSAAVADSAANRADNATTADHSVPARAVATGPAASAAPAGAPPTGTRPRTPAGADGERQPAPGMMERITGAEEYLKSVLGEVARPLTDEERERIVQDGAFRDWMVEVESKLGENLDDPVRREIRARQMETIDVRNRLQEAYLSGAVDWATYLEGMRSVSLWSDAPYQRLLTQEQYNRLNGFNKAEMGAMTEAVWQPPETIEAVNFFPQIRASNPDITAEELSALIPVPQLDYLSGLRKAQLLQETRLAADLNSGKLDQGDFLRALQENQAVLANEAKKRLSPAGYRLLYPEAPAPGSLP